MISLGFTLVLAAEDSPSTGFRRATEGELDWSPYRKPIDNVEDFDKAIKLRWNSERIVAFKQLNEPTKVWGKMQQKGEWLFGKWAVNAKGQEPIEVNWCVDQVDGKISFYRVTCTQGKDSWSVDYGTMEDLKRPPYLISFWRH